MSTQRGNTSRRRPQKHKNVTAFKNDLHDTSPRIHLINSIEVANVCRKCCNILEWKIKYKKYKPLKVPRKCTKCEQKCVKNAYHIMCLPCSKTLNVCPKCGKNEEILKKSVSSEDKFKLDVEMQQMIKSLSERKRRTFLRYMSKQCGAGNDGGSDEINPNDIKESLLTKLESLNIEEEEEEDDDDSFGLNDEDASDDNDDNNDTTPEKVSMKVL